jgi:hypothetical protein
MALQTSLPEKFTDKYAQTSLPESVIEENRAARLIELALEPIFAKIFHWRSTTVGPAGSVSANIQLKRIDAVVGSEPSAFFDEFLSIEERLARK